MSGNLTWLFHPGMHQKLTEACREAAGFVVRKKGVSEFMAIFFEEVEWTQDACRATRFATHADAERAARSDRDEIVPYWQAMDFALKGKPNPKSINDAAPQTDETFVVTLTKLDQSNSSGVYVSGGRVEELLPKLNARGLLSEFGAPMHFPAMGADEWKRRLLTVIDHVCCRLTQFRIEQIDGEWCLTATATPVGFFKDAFVAMMKTNPAQGRFDLRCVSDDVYVGGDRYRAMRDIITFDFIEKQETKE